MWENNQLSAFLQELTKIARVILFDKRGTGLSDRFTELSLLEDRMDDIRAVMDAADSERAVLFGHSEGGSVSALFAATYPDRTLALITFGVFAKRRYSEDYPWAPSDEERQNVYDMIEQNWEEGEMNLASLAPSMANDVHFMDWLSRYFRAGASASAALVLTQMNTQIDIINILDAIEVPSLFMCRTHDIDVKVEESKFMAERVKGSKVVEFEGDDHLFWVGNTNEVLDEIFLFLTDSPRSQIEIPRASEKITQTATSNTQLATILCLELLYQPSDVLSRFNEQEVVEQCAKYIQENAHQYRGHIRLNQGSQYVLSFEGPSKAIHCALAIRQAIHSFHVQVKAGVHIGDSQFDKNHSTDGNTFIVARKLLEIAANNEILVTRTVQHLLSGSGLDFISRGTMSLSDLDDSIDIMLVEDVMAEEDAVLPSSPESNKNHSFLENILQSIENHLADEQFGVETLCKEVGMGQRQLQRKLKSIANKTPNQMIRSVRLHRAKELILNKKEGVSEAAFRTGFTSLSYFAKCFKKEFGILPSLLNAEFESS